MRCIKKFLTQWVSALIVLALAALSSFSSAQQVHIAHCIDGCPSGTDQEEPDRLLVRHLFAASIAQSGLAKWVAYRVLPDTVGVASLLPRYWQLDALVGSAESFEQEVGESNQLVEIDLSDAQDSDYRVNEVNFIAGDRARLAPMTSFAGTPYWNELNYLSNMTPMPADLRTGAWARLDQAVNELAQKGAPFYVLSGPLYIDETELSEGISEPFGFFKVLAQGTSYVGFVFPASIRPQSNYCDYQEPLSEIARRSGLDFFPNQAIDWKENLATQLSCGHF